jgi:hypothetical protein
VVSQQPTKRWCDQCGLESRDPKFQPILKVGRDWLCEPCRKRKERDEGHKCKCSGLPIRSTPKPPCSEEKH